MGLEKEWVLRMVEMFYKEDVGRAEKNYLLKISKFNIELKRPLLCGLFKIKGIFYEFYKLIKKKLSI